ncbi:MAG TPA: efflux RND transporter permease subunit [Ignavibacteriales bacterium]|nr:efflux RND transporter permease subunit [Ignavibacteriales bacterium]
MKSKSTLIDVLLRYKQVIYIFTGICILTGIIALFIMPRDEYPEFRITQGLIVGIYPGASSHQVEEQITSKVENYLFRYKSVDRAKTYSVSKENVMVIYVEVSENEKDPEQFWAKLRHGLNELKAELPTGVVSLTADNDFGNTSVLLLGVQSETKTYKELEDVYVKQLENRLRRIQSISKVKHYGALEEQISVYLDNTKLTHYGIKPMQMFAVLKPQSSVIYSGEYNDGNLMRPIHIPSTFKTEQDIANQIVFSDPLGHVLRVKDVAKITREYDEPDSYVRVNGKKAIVVALEMKSGENVVSLGDDVEETVEKFSKTLPPDVKIITVSDVPHAVSKSINNFLKEFLIAILSVIFVTILLLPGKVARIAALAIPTSIFTAIGIMWAAGINLQTVSLAGLIIVLGITVDDAIVIIDNYIEKLDEGMTPREAATHSVTELFTSVLSATTIIVFCFLPMPIFLIGPAADFVRSLPLTIISALIVSLLVSITLIPIINYSRIKTGLKANNPEKKRKTFLDIVQKYYDSAIERAFRHKKVVVMIGALTFIIGLIILGTTPQQAFPKIERNQFAVEVYLPEGSSIEKTDEVIKDIEKKFQQDSRIKVVTSFIGTSSPRFHALYAPNFPAKNYGQLVILTESNEEVKEILDEYSKKFKGYYPNANIKWKQLAIAIAKSPIEVRISGDDIPTIKAIADTVEKFVRNTEGSEYVRTDYEQPLQSADLILKKDEAARMGYSNAWLGYSLLLGTKGFPIADVWEGDYQIGVKLKIDKKTKTSPDDIMNQYITAPFLVSSSPVRELADIKPGWSEGQIVRRNGVRTITVRSEVEREVLPSAVFEKIRPLVDNLNLPEGISIEYGGENSDSKENLTPFYYSLVVSIVIIFLILMFQFKKVKTSLIIMVTLPLSIFGAAFGIFIMGYPFGVTAFIGLIGLMGIVVRNGVIFITYANELRSNQGYTIEQAAIAAGKRRMRPIFLTSAAAAVGVIPMTVSGSSLWGPLGTVICFGLLFALVLSLLVLPVIYCLFSKSETNKANEGLV